MADKKTEATFQTTSLGKNIEAHLEDTTLVLRIDLAQRLGRSQSGKTVIIATTGGNQSLPEHPAIKLGLNLYLTGE